MTNTWDGRWPDTTMTLPAVGEMVKFERKANWRGDREVGAGVVMFCYMGEEPAIKLETGVSLFPTLGDTWQPDV